MIQLFLLFIGIFILWYFNSNQCVCIDTFSIGQKYTCMQYGENKSPFICNPGILKQNASNIECPKAKDGNYYKCNYSLCCQKFNNQTLKDAVVDWVQDKQSAIKKYGDINTWDTSGVTDMSNMFYQPYHTAHHFNDNISGWDTSNVTDMSNMFYKASSFSGDISGWNTSNVTDMSGMFYDCFKFSGDISGWNTSNVTDMSRMFFQATIFNADISGWNTSSVTDMSHMFQYATSFNGNLDCWNTRAAVDTVDNMFYGSKIGNSKNDPVSSGCWNVVRSGKATCNDCQKFNNTLREAVQDWILDKQSAKIKYGDINTWDTSGVTTMSGLFSYAYNFNDNISGWDTSNVVTMSNMFQAATSFNGDISGWNTSRVTDMSNMFNNALSFNGDISSWDTSGVTDMSHMFSYAHNFNADISGWNTSNVADMTSMFYWADSFNGDISGWDTSRVNHMVGMFNYATNFNNGKLKGQSYTFDWNVLRCENMNSMFANATSFNGDISSWKAEPINLYYSMVSMFENATSFNGNLDCWDTRTSNPIDYKDMFIGSKIGNSKNDPISSGCWGAVRSGKATCNDCEKYNCDGNTGNCVKSFNGSFSDKVSCEKEGCLTKTEFNENYCNNDTAFTYCNHRTNQENGCTEDILTDRNNKPIHGYTSNNYCVPLRVQHDFMCVPKCNPDINDCKRQEHHDAFGSGCTNSDVIHSLSNCESGYDENLTDNNSLCKWDEFEGKCLPEPNNICV
jgi:surface protein